MTAIVHLSDLAGMQSRIARAPTAALPDSLLTQALTDTPAADRFGDADRVLHQINKAEAEERVLFVHSVRASIKALEPMTIDEVCAVMRSLLGANDGNASVQLQECCERIEADRDALEARRP